MKKKMLELGIDGGDGASISNVGQNEMIPRNGMHRHHTPHSCCHTFSRLCESYGVREADRRRMLGHSFGNDITNGVYGHRRLEELREQIEKIEKKKHQLI